MKIVAGILTERSPCVTSWINVGPTFPIAAVLKPWARAMASSVCSPR